jgi:thiol-disulfide isomerase/thioredoxin
MSRGAVRDGGRASLSADTGDEGFTRGDVAMCRELVGVVLALVGLAALVEAAAPPWETLDSLRKEYRTKLSSLRQPDDRKAADAWFRQRLLVFAKRNPKTDDAFNALATCVTYCRSHIPKDSPGALAVAILRKDYVEHKDMILKAHMLGHMADEGCAELLRAVIERHPDRRTRAKACHALAKGRLYLADLGDSLKPGTIRYLLGGRNIRCHFEMLHHVDGTHGQDYVDVLVANAKKYRGESDAMSKRLVKDYPGMVPDLSIGKAAPEVISQDLDGKQTRLSALRGKVVVLDIWATWCGPCCAMIPHEREMVKRLQGKPFALVSISVDDDKEKVVRFLKKTPMPWSHWWNGPSRGMVNDWDVTGYPTIYVLDHKGVIRYTNLRDKELEAAVTRLLREMEREKTQAAAKSREAESRPPKD